MRQTDSHKRTITIRPLGSRNHKRTIRSLGSDGARPSRPHAGDGAWAAGGRCVKTFVRNVVAELEFLGRPTIRLRSCSRAPIALAASDVAACERNDDAVEQRRLQSGRRRVSRGRPYQQRRWLRGFRVSGAVVICRRLWLRHDTIIIEYSF
jgi:hypothetical protein